MKAFFFSFPFRSRLWPGSWFHFSTRASIIQQKINLMITFITVRKDMNQFNAEEVCWKCGNFYFRVLVDRDKTASKERREIPSGNKTVCGFNIFYWLLFFILVIQSICCFGACGWEEKRTWGGRTFEFSYNARHLKGRKNCYQNEIDKMFTLRVCLFNKLPTLRTFFSLPLKLSVL